MNKKKEEFTDCIAELDKLLEGAAEGVYVSDIETYELLYANDFVRGVFHKDCNENYKGRKCYEYLFGKDKPCEFCKMHQVKEAEYLFREFNLPDSDNHFILKGRRAEWEGRKVYLEFIFSERGTLIERYEKKMQETTYKKEKMVENALVIAQRANDVRNELLSRVSREMKTPIKTVEEELCALLEDVPKENQEAVSKIIRKTQRIRRMIDNMVDLSEYTQGVLDFENSEINLMGLLDSIYEALRPVAEEKDIRLSFLYELNGLDKIYEDEYRLRQIFMNLLSNAITFSEKGMTVSCTIDMDEYQGETALMKVVITDEGIGMEETFMRRAYRPFEKEERKPSVDGIGLGLPVVTHMIEQKEGRIWIESRPYEGTKVSFVLPIQISDSCLKKGRRSVEGTLGKMKKVDFSHLRALVIAEDEIIRQTANIILQKMKIMVESASNRQQAVNMVAESKEGYYDILFVQMGMSLKGAILALREIHMLDRIDVHEMPIVAMNIDLFLEDMQNAGEAEIDYQWVKPYKTEELRKILYKEFYPEQYREIYEKKGFRVVK